MKYELQAHKAKQAHKVKQKGIKKMTKQAKERMEKVGQNMIMDRILMGVSAFVLMALAARGLLPFISAPQPVNYLLAGGFLSTIMYLILSPFFRK